MRLTDDARRCVVYLGHKKAGTDNEIVPVGTGFLVHMDVPDGVYLVTAAHVALKLEDIEFDVRLNEHYRLHHGERKPPGRLHHIETARWFYHPTDPTVDVAVLRYDPPDWSEQVCFPYRGFLSEFKLGTKNIGPGDFAYVVGILHFMHGTTRNMPAVHTGHIVLMPDEEKIPINNWRSTSPKARRMRVDAYLVQATALPGSSGSPVFVRRSLDTMLDLPELQQPDPLNVAIPGSLWFLGVWRGAWFGKASDGLNLPKHDGKVPVGLGTVVPAIKVADVLNHPELQQMRSAALHAERKRVNEVSDQVSLGAVDRVALPKADQMLKQFKRKPK